MPSLSALLYQLRRFEHPEVLRHRSERDVGQGAVDVARALLLPPDQAQDLAPAGSCESAEQRMHETNLVNTKIYVKGRLSYWTVRQRLATGRRGRGTAS